MSAAMNALPFPDTLQGFCYLDIIADKVHLIQQLYAFYESLSI